MDYSLTEEQKALKSEFEVFFREEMKNAPPECSKNLLEAMYSTDEGWAFHRSMQKKLANKGWLTLAWPKQYGGKEAPILDQLLFNEVYGYYRAVGVDLYGIGMFAPTLMLFGTEDQKKRILVPIGRGEVNYCQGWSEPNAGSDLAALETTALRDGDYYVVNGQKTWTTGGHRASHMFLLARTDPKEKRGKGLSMFHLSMDTPGIEVRPVHYLNGEHTFNEVFFKDVKIPIDDRIGAENEGWKLTRETMNFERSSVGVFAWQKRSLEEIVEYVKTTKRGGKYLREDAAVRRKVAGMYQDIKRGLALAYRIAWNQEKGGLRMSPHMASESKVIGTELSQRIAELTTEIMGLHGQLSDSKWAPLNGRMVSEYELAPGPNIAAGSSEIQRNIIAWVGAGLPRF